MRLALRLITPIAILHSILTGPLDVNAQSQVRPQPIAWSIEVREAPLRAGTPFSATLHASIPHGWHLYGLVQENGGPISTHVIVDSGGVFELAGPLIARAPDLARDASFEVATATYSDSVSIVAPIIARAPGSQVLRLTVEYQSCTDRLCMPPRRVALTLPLTIGASLTHSDSTFELTPRLPNGGAATAAVGFDGRAVSAAQQVAPKIFPLWKVALAVVGTLLLVVTIIHLRGRR